MFDYIVANPPYQGLLNSSPIWQKITLKMFDLLTDGQMTIVHPGNWKLASKELNTRKESIRMKELLCTYNVTSLQSHSSKEGSEVFGATTTFDHYVIDKTLSKTPGYLEIQTKTDGVTLVDLNKVKHIPCDRIEDYMKLIKNPIKLDCRFKPTASNTPGEYKMLKKLILDWDKNVGYTNKQSELGKTPKLVIGRGATYTFLDEFGEWEINLDGFYILGDVEHLKKVQEAFKNDYFKTLMSEVTGSTDKRTMDPNRLSRNYITELSVDFYDEL